MNDAFDNSRTDREALEKLTREAERVEAGGDMEQGRMLREVAATFDPETGEVFDSDAPDNGGWDKERHCATDLRGADWAGRKLREAQEQMVQNLAMVQDELDDLRRREKAVWERLEKADAPFQKTAAFMENALRVFAETHRDEVLKGLTKKSRLLPSGVTLGWRKTGGGLRLKEGEGAAAALKELIAWADRPEMPRALLRRPDPEPALNSIKAYAKSLTTTWTDVASGERQVRLFTPPGMERAPEVDELYVSTGIETEEES